MEQGYINTAAIKINERLTNLRESGDENLQRRWIWELIQNASDCAEPEVNIEINQNSHILEFMHDGVPFDYESLMSIVTQFSDKGLKEKDTTGQFGTGFITTHLLSERVGVRGLFRDNRGDGQKFSTVIDRSGKNVHDIRQQVTESLEELKQLKFLSSDIGLSNDFTTAFKYNLEDSNISAVYKGRDDFEKTAFYVLAFVETIRTITYNQVCYTKKTEHNIDNNLKRVKVSKKDHQSEITKDILISSNGDVQVAVEIVEKDNLTYIQPFQSDIPKLFCNFPLVGTNTYFPAIINSSNFGVQQERNGIREGSEQNYNIVLQAVDLYQAMIEYVSQNMYMNIFEMCFLKVENLTQIQKKIKDKLWGICSQTPIIYNNKGDFSKLNDKEGKPQTCIPTIRKSTGTKLWDLLNSMENFPPIPEKNNSVNWEKALGYNFTLEDLCDGVAKKESLGKLQNFFNDETSLFSWLTNFYILLNTHQDGELFKRYNVLINQKNSFTTSYLKLSIDSGIDEELKDILSDLGKDIRSHLISKRVDLPEEISKLGIESLTNIDLVNEISDKVRKILSDEAQTGNDREEETQRIFDKLMLWFMRYPKKAKELFLDIYENKHNLSTKEQLIEKFEFAEKTKEKLEQHSIGSLDELDRVLYGFLEGKSLSGAGVDELLMGLAIDDIKELESSKSLESVKNLLKHVPTPTVEALKIVEEKIERSKKHVINQLSAIPDYDISNMRELGKTVYGDIYKHGRKIKVIIRPSDSNMIILYYQSELDALDDENYELWVDCVLQ